MDHPYQTINFFTKQLQTVKPKHTQLTINPNNSSDTKNIHIKFQKKKNKEKEKDAYHGVLESFELRVQT